MFNSKFKKAMAQLETEIMYAELRWRIYGTEYELEPNNAEKAKQRDYWKAREDALVELRDKISQI